MTKMLLVLKNELVAIVTRRSFILTLILLPLVSYSTILVVSALQPDQEPNLVSQIMVSPVEPDDLAEGLVDPARLVKDLPPWIASNHFTRYEDEADAREALYNGEIGAYYRIAADYLTSGKVTAYSLEINPLQSAGADVLRDAINYNLLGRDETLTRRVANPVEVQTAYLNGEPQRDPENMLTFFVPYIVTILFYIVIFGSASMMLSSIAWEKQNRIMEILITSLTPTQLLTGKIIALGSAGLLQTVVWTAAGYGLLRLSGRMFELPAGFDLPPSILAWGVVFFLLGYALYASLMAGIGALVPGLREASQLTTLVVIPLMMPMLMIGLIINSPNGAAAVILSLIPLTAPVAVMMRLSVAAVPLWQLLLTVAIMALSVVWLLRFVAGLFRASNLLSGQGFSARRFLRALRGKS